MSHIQMPEPDAGVIARRDPIVAISSSCSAPGVVIADEDGRRAFETDALTAYRCDAAGRRAAALDRGGLEAPALLPREQHEGGARAAPAPRCRAARFPPRTPSSSASRA